MLIEGWESIILDTFKEGESQEFVLTKLNISISVHSNLMNDDIEYSEVWNKGLLIRKAWVYRNLKDLASGGKGNPACAIFLAKNVLGYGDMNTKDEKTPDLNDNIKAGELRKKYEVKQDEKTDTVN